MMIIINVQIVMMIIIVNNMIIIMTIRIRDNIFMIIHISDVHILLLCMIILLR